MNDSDINDLRTENEFKGMTFSKFKKTDVKKQLLNSIYSCKIEQALYWSAEFICSGNFIEVWDFILNYVGKYIHLGNPKLPIYILLRFQQFKDVLQNGYIGSELSMRNNFKIRKLFAEIICILCKSRKKHSIEQIKIKKSDEFDLSNMSSKLKAPDVSFAQTIFKKDDPKELFISVNELCFHLSKKSKNALEACYWFEWILEFENICKKKKESCFIERRPFSANVDDKFQKEPIWIIWDCILFYSKSLNNKIIDKIINALLDLFCIRFTNGSKKKRKYLIYFAISLITDTCNLNLDIIEDKNYVEKIISKINVIYKEIKKNEISPETDYLFNGIQKSNTEKTIEKLEILNNMNTIIRN